MRERYNEYTPPISSDLRQSYEDALSGEMRWIGGIELTKRDESDLDHVRSMLDIHDEVSHTYPRLFHQINTDDVAPMIYLHDAGEIYAHDLAHTTPNYDALKPKVKKREAAAFRLLTRQYIGDIELRAYARKLYRRYEEKRPEDIQSHYVQFLDKAQATRFGSVFVFNGKWMSRQMRIQKLNHVGHQLQGPSIRLYPLLDEEGRSELHEWVDHEFGFMSANGYRSDEVRRELSLIHSMLDESVT